MARPMIEHIRNTNSKSNLIGVEIGVHYGNNALNILKALSIKQLYLIDPYDSYVEKGIFWKTKYKDIYKEVRKKFEKYKVKVKFIKRKSIDAIELIPNRLDFVYIDGNHTFKAVKKDIESYYPKVKNGGIIGGHDFDSPNVLAAVIFCIIKYNLYRDFRFNRRDWWVVKKEK